GHTDALIFGGHDIGVVSAPILIDIEVEGLRQVVEGHVRTGEVDERIAPAETRVDVDHGDSAGCVEEHVDVDQAREIGGTSDQLRGAHEWATVHRDGLVGLSGSHPDLATGQYSCERTAVSEAGDDVHPVFDSWKLRLHHHIVGGGRPTPCGGGREQGCDHGLADVASGHELQSRRAASEPVLDDELIG